SIPWSQIGAKAGADYKGDGLAVSPTAGGARLRCVFQRLEGEATREGLWLTSTVIPPSGTVNDRFRVVATAVRRLDGAFGVPALAQSMQLNHGWTRMDTEKAGCRTSFANAPQSHQLARRLDTNNSWQLPLKSVLIRVHPWFSDCI